MEPTRDIHISYEPFTAAFTGLLTTFTSASGGVFTLAKPHMRVQRGQAFMVKINTKDKCCTLIPVVLPHPFDGVK